MTDLYAFLDKHNIAYQRHDHPPVFTVADVKKLVPELPGTKTKNLFLRDKPGKRHFLVIVPDDKRVDMKKMPAALESGRLSFGSPDRLEKHLGIAPGAVSLFAVVNDPGLHVEVVVDREIWDSDTFQFHPLVNTATLVISRENVRRFLKATGHEVRVRDIPGA